MLDQISNVVSCSSVINAYVEKGDLEKAEQWFQWTTEAALQSDEVVGLG